MKRHNLVFRKLHAEKRSDVQEDDIDMYLNSLANAVIKYGINRIFNMDETQINNFYLPNKTISIKGTETIKIKGTGHDIKEGTTYIGTTYMNPEIRFPMVVIAKGTTSVSEQKYKSDSTSKKI